MTRGFRNLVMFVDAAGGGSMFDPLMTDDMDIYVMTSGSSMQKSWACCFDGIRKQYTATYFSMIWMQVNSDKNYINNIDSIDCQVYSTCAYSACELIG